MSATSPARRWQQIVVAVQQELSCASEDERQWIEQQLANIHELQRQLQHLFIQADGFNQCQHCGGECCVLGNNHMTLVNLLSGLLYDNLPAADFNRSCPFMNDHGCALAVETRPFNCVTFICERIEQQLSRQQLEQFYAMERQLRELYLAFDHRYAGSSLRGLLIRSRSMAGSHFLARCK